MLRTEEKPVLSLRADCFSFLQVCAKRRHARTRSNHNDWRVPVLGEAKLRRIRENRHGNILRALGQESGANAFAHAATAFVVYHVNGEMHLVGVRL